MAALIRAGVEEARAAVGADTLTVVTAPRPPLSRALVAGLALVVVGLVGWALYAVAAASANESYDPHGAPPEYVQLVSGHTYWLAVPNGVTRLSEAGLDPSAVSCTAAAPGQAAGALSVTAVVSSGSTDTKFVNRIASFVAAHSGRFHVECTRIGAVYVENAADHGFDWSGFWLVLASAALVVGLPLTLSGLRRPSPAPRDVPVASGD